MGSSSLVMQDTLYIFRNMCFSHLVVTVKQGSGNICSIKQKKVYEALMLHVHGPCRMNLKNREVSKCSNIL